MTWVFTFLFTLLFTLVVCENVSPCDDYSNLFLMKLKAPVWEKNNNQRLKERFANNSIPSLTHCDKYPIYSRSSPPPPPPSGRPECENQVACQIPIHDENLQKLQIVTQDAYLIPCSFTFSKSCTGVEEFFRAHNCTPLTGCRGCCSDTLSGRQWLALGTSIPIVGGIFVCFAVGFCIFIGCTKPPRTVNRINRTLTTIQVESSINGRVVNKQSISKIPKTRKDIRYPRNRV